MKKRDANISFATKLMLQFFKSTFLYFVIATTLISVFFNVLNNRNIESLSRNYINAIARNIDVYIGELEQITLAPYYNDDIIYYLKKLSYNKSISAIEEAELSSLVGQLLSFLRHTRNDIENIILVQGDICIYSVTTNPSATILTDFPFNDTKWYSRSAENLGSTILTSADVLDYIVPTPDEKMFSISRGVYDISSRDLLGVIKIDANTDVLSEILEETTFTVSSNVFITDNNHEILYANSDAEIPNNLFFAEDTDDIYQITDNGLTHMVKLTDSGLSLHVILDRNEMIFNTALIFYGSFTIYLFAGIIAFISYRRSSKRVTSVIEDVRDTLIAFEDGDFSVRCNVDFSKEFDSLSDSINHMIIEFDKNIKHRYLSTIRRKDAELKALQAQIEPHFLFNTLNSFIALSQDPTKEEQEILEKSLFSLCSILRYSFAKTELVNISTELKILDDYLRLQKLRFSDRFNYSIKNNLTENFSIPRLSLQPFVENSIIHGIEPSDNPCNLDISVDYNEYADRLTIKIVDDGVGCDDDLKKAKGLGVSNSIERIKMCYQVSHVEITSSQGNGCSVEINIRKPMWIGTEM